MAVHPPHNISLGELEKAIKSAVQQLEHHKVHGATEIAKSNLIMGRWIKLPLADAQATAAANEITRQVVAKVPGLKAEPFSANFPGGATLGFILHEE